MRLAVLYEEVGIFVVHPFEEWRDAARFKEISAVCVGFDVVRLSAVFYRLDVDIVSTYHDHEVLCSRSAFHSETASEVVGAQIGGWEKLG